LSVPLKLFFTQPADIFAFRW